MQTSREDIIAVAARLFAIFLIYLVISRTPMAVESLTMSDDSMSHLGMYVIALVACLAMAALLWMFPLTVARKLLPVMKEPRSDTAVNGSLALSLGMMLMGVWLLGNALLDAVYWLTYLTASAQLGEFAPEWLPNQTAGVWATVAQALLAFVLIFGSTGIRRLLYRIRYGQDAPGE